MSGGRLVVVGTPVGNLGDLSPRAVEALRAVDVLACEDTRRTGRLLAHVGVPAPELLRLDATVERDRTPALLDRIRGGDVVGLVSDAGMPGISDPGAHLIGAARAADLDVEVIPGPVAATVALVASGLCGDTGRFTFEGFLPRRGRDRTERLAGIASSSCVSVVYESPHRVVDTVTDLRGVCGGDRAVAVCRELTKLYEEVWTGTLDAAVDHLAEREPRGEYVVVVDAAPPAEPAPDVDLLQALEVELAGGATRRDAARTVAERFGVGVNRVKRLLDDGDD
jgi:16S rRNA (cytidine1402-2'-O)-methyltransferase